MMTLGTTYQVIVGALLTSTLFVLGTAAMLGIARLLMRQHAALRHVMLTALLTASVIALAVSLSGIRTTVEVPWWRPVIVPRTADADPVHEVAQPSHAPLPSGGERTVAWLWLAGAVWIVLRAARQAATIRALRRRATPATDRRWTDASASIRSAAGFVQPITILVSPEIDVPFVTGIVRPAIVVPSASIEWSDEERRSVLAHEIAHLTRRDLWARAAGTLACALHWFNPIVWWLAWHAERDAELAADDLALRTGVLPSEYAATLLSLAEKISWRHAGPVALAFLRRSSLEPRILAVLAPASQAAVVTDRLRLTVIGASCAVAATVGCVTLAPITLVVPSRPDRTATPPAASQTTTGWVDNAAQALVETLNDPSPQVRTAAADALSRFNDPKSRAIVDRALAGSGLTRDSLDSMREDKK